MKSILEEVKSIEAEAQQRLAAAQAEGQQQVQVILTKEPTVIKEVRAAAEVKATALINEAVQKAKAEAAQLIEDENRVKSRISAQVEQNRAQVLSLAEELLRQAG
jgi:vacuolar-type H+-ATPase subunit H